jgi:pimeloyl-ACP methyl ester carboxylesterase
MVSVTWQLLLLCVGLGAVGMGLAGLAVIIWRYTQFVVRIFEEKPLFIIPRGLPIEGSQDVRLRTRDGLTLAGSYIPTAQSKRRGVVLFGTEYGSNRWSCSNYCRHLLDEGYDVFTFEFRSQGQSDPQPGYEPLQWVTDYEVEDMRAALAYLKKRPDADPRGVGFFGISRGGGAGIVAAAADPWVRCLVTDGAFATRTTMIPYMQKWASIYLSQKWLAGHIPGWVYSLVASYALRKVAGRRHCRFPNMERAIARLSPRPLLMIHGGEDKRSSDMPASPRSSGSWPAPSTTRRCTWPARSIAGASLSSSTSILPASQQASRPSRSPARPRDAPIRPLPLEEAPCSVGLSARS